MNRPGEEPSRSSPRVALLFTRYPVTTETFLQREVEVLKGSGGEYHLLALWPSSDSIEGRQADRSFSPWHLLKLLLWLPYWALRRPRALHGVVHALLVARRPNLTNLLEMLLGCAYAVVEAHALTGRFDHFHGMWASAPATAAWALSKLTDTPFSMAGHAYDLFEDGGDGLLPVKIPEACFIRTSTESARTRWLELGAQPGQVHVIRRGLVNFPAFTRRAKPIPPYQFLCVGRMVEKMGFPDTLLILAGLNRKCVPFSATFIGDGPMREELEAAVRHLGLAGMVTFTGALPYVEVEDHFASADLFLFTGKVARSGDRAGFPNAIGEAMAWGVPVCATPVGAVLEGIHDGETGIVAPDPDGSVVRIMKLLGNADEYHRVRAAARTWAEREFDARVNMERFTRLLSR